MVAALILGFEPIERTINETINRGTLKGVETCVAYSSSNLISEETIRTTCVNSFQKRLHSRDHATGRAGPRWNENTVFWNGTLENKTPDHVTTWVQILVEVFDEDGAKKEYSADTSIWIEPLHEVEFRVKIGDLEPEQIKDVEFCEHEASSPKGCMTWGITDAMGLKI